MEVNSLEKKHGWSENPFNYKRKTGDHVGFIELKEEVLQNIRRENICHIYGNVGTGKSTLLEWISQQDHRFNQDIEIQYFETANLSPESLENFYSKGLLEKISGAPTKRVVLIDNSQNLSEEIAKKLEIAHERGDIHSIVLASIDENLNITQSLEDRIGDRRRKVRKMEKIESKKMIENRLEGMKNPFTEEAVEQIAEMADFRPRQILEYCEIIASEVEPPISEEDPIGEVVGEVKEREQISGMTRKELLEKLPGRPQEILETLYDEGPLDSEGIVDQDAAPSKNSLRPYLHKLSDKDKMKENRDIPLKLVEKEDSEAGADSTEWDLTDEARTLLAKN